MYKKDLVDSGLDKNQAEVYEKLLTIGKSKGSDIAKGLSISRQLTYKALEDLEANKLVRKIKPKEGPSLFELEHPSSLLDLIDKKKQNLDLQRNMAEKLSEKMQSDFNLVSGKPGVQFFEGIKGVKKILEETLQDKNDTIYTYVDTTTLEQEVLDIDEQYVQKRLKKGIKKKILMLKTPEAEKYVKNRKKDPFTEIKLIENPNVKNFYSVTQIYDGKVAFMTFENKLLTTTLIQDKSIYEMNKFVFESIWNNCKCL